jgi:hypothetical protein
MLLGRSLDWRGASREVASLISLSFQKLVSERKSRFQTEGGWNRPGKLDLFSLQMSLTFIAWIGNQGHFQRSWAAGVFCSGFVVLYRAYGMKPVWSIPAGARTQEDDWDFTA